MEDTFPQRTNSGTGPGKGSGEARRLRISEFHQNTRRAPSFYARANSPGNSPLPQEPDWRDSRPEPLRRPLEEKKPRGPWVLILTIGLIVAGLGGSAAGYFIGAHRGRNIATREMENRARTMSPLPTEDVAVLNQAVADIRTGEARRALGALESLRQKFPQASSLSYLAALAALQAGQPIASESFVKDSMRSGQRISDSLALLAMLERRKPDFTGEKKAHAEELLRAAITADAANPSPHFELAMILRDDKRHDEARQELLAAQARLNPVDSHAVIEATLALMKLEETGNAELPQPAATSDTIAESLSASYTAMRQGQFEKAAAALRAGKAMVTPDVFYFLVNDPVFAPYKNEKEIASFWR